MNDADSEYRRLVDAMVEACNEGQGQIAASRVHAGVWNEHVDEHHEQQAINELLATLTLDQRAVLAGLLTSQYRSGMFGALVVLSESETHPFDRAYEGSPFEDFMGRVDGWQWPENEPTSS